MQEVFTLLEVEAIVERTVLRTLEKVGAIPKYISRKEMIQRIGRGNYDRGVREGYLKIIKKGGKTSTVSCLRSEFENYEQMILT